MTEHELMARAVRKHRAREHRIAAYAGFVLGGLTVLIATAALADGGAKAELKIRSELCANYDFHMQLCNEGDQFACYFIEDAIRKDAVCPGTMNMINPGAGEVFPDGTIAISDDDLVEVE